MASRNSISKKSDRVWERKNKDGSTTYLGVVRIKPFKSASKAFKTKVEARQWADALSQELIKQRDQGETRPTLTTLTLKGLIEAFLADPETVQLKYFPNLEQLLAWWVNHCGGEKVMEFGTVKLREARELLSNGRGPATVNRYLSALRSCWNWGRAAQYVPAEKVWPTRLFRTEPRERVRFLNDGELKAVLDAAFAYAPWMHAAVVTSLATGLRQGELLRLDWKDVDFDRNTVVVLISKNTKRRIVHLPAPAAEALRALRRNGIVGPKPVFVDSEAQRVTKDGLSFHWKRVRKTAGLVDFRWHDLRHSCASFLAQNGASLVEIGTVLGHSSPSITAKYSHLVAGRPVTGADKLAEKLLGGA